MGGRPAQTGIDYDDEMKLIQRYLKIGMSQKEIADRMGKSTMTIRTRMREMGLLNQKKVEGGKKGFIARQKRAD